MASTIKAVAEAAGVSTTTVSFVLNNRRPHIDAIPKETRERVRMCAAALGYRRNAAAASLRTGKSHWIGVLVQGMKDEGEVYEWARYELALLSGIQNALSARDYFAVLGSRSDGNGAENLEAIISSGVGGIIHRSPRKDELAKLHELSKNGVKVLAVFPEKKDDLYPYSIDVDNYGAGRLAAEQFLKAKRRNIACFLYDDSLEAAQDRWQGLCDTIALNQGNSPALCKLPRHASPDEWVEIAASFISDHHPDAIMAVDATSGKQALTAADKLNISVPDDLAIVGFDCYHMEDEHHRRISSVATSWWKAGQIAAKSMLDFVCNHTEWTEPRKLEPAFIPGDTTPL